ncbi:MAG: metallophosphoesterase [Planctomycetaceae bacterium]|nr:MAG: metallophosphoesterase [Planctomycetaceae bacterium]
MRILSAKLGPLLVLLVASWTFADSDPQAKGIVFHDVDGDGIFDATVDEPLAGVAVSNGREVVVTCEDGRYELPLRDPSTIFVIKPRGWAVPVDEMQIPRFYYLHMPQGATGTRYPGLDPTPALPESLDFALRPQEEPDRYDVLVLGDTQPRDLTEIDYIARDVLPEVIGIDAAFGVTLGDLVFDDLNLFDPLNEAIATIGLPWRSLIGNHDIDFTGDTDVQARGAFYRTYGPSYYAFTWGPTHYIVLDSFRWLVSNNRRTYRTGLGEEQLTFLRNELARIPDDQLVVVLSHIPWVDSTGWVDESHRDEVFQVLASHPRMVTLAAHTHRHYHRWIGPDDGWPGEQPHHLVSVGTACGAWCCGAPDEYGIPHAMMSDGTPTGYAILEIDGPQWKVRWQSARRPADFQMHLDAPSSVRVDQSAEAEVLANIFNALPDARVQMRIGTSSPWQEMQRSVRPDPVRLSVMERERQLGEVPWRPLGGAQASQHIWTTTIGRSLEPGTHVIEVRAEDDWWSYEGRRLIRVTAP